MRSVPWAAIAAMTVGTGLAAGEPTWFVYRNHPGARVSVRTGGPGGSATLCFQYRRNETHHATIIADQKPPLKVTAQHKAVFSMRGEPGNEAAKLAMCLSVPSQKRSFRPGPQIATTSERWRRYVFSLNTDFGLPDAVHAVSQLKFTLNLRNQAVGASARVWIRGIAIVEAGELSLGDAGNEFVVSAVHRKPAPPIDLPVLRVFSDFDNEDRTEKVYSSRHRDGIAEPVAGPGYRHLLTIPLDNCIEQIDSLDQRPHVTVVCRPVPGKTAPGDARKWVEAGGGLLLYGACAGYERLLPGTLGPQARGGARRKLTVSRPDHLLFANLRWKEDVSLIPFGAFEPAAGARALAVFDDGTPAIVEAKRARGRVLFFNFGPGKSLTPATEFYDELAMRALYWLAGHAEPAALLPTIDRELAMRRAEREQRIVKQTLAAAGIDDPSGWRLGMSVDNVSRFGWAIDEGLLVANVNRHLQLTCGETALGVGFPRAPGAARTANPHDYEVTDVNWVCKTARVTFGSRKLVMRQSMLSPFVLYETQDSTLRLTFGHVPSHAAYLGASGPVTCKLDRPNSLAQFARDARAGWLLIWEDEESHPLLLVFQKRVRLKLAFAQGAVERLIVEADGSVGAMLAGHPFGVARVDSSKWSAHLPPTACGAATFWHGAALAYPVACDEAFRLDLNAKKTRIANRVHFLTIRDEWGTQPVRLAPLPPLVGFAMDRKILVTDCSPVVDTGLPTKYGRLKAVRDSSAIAYSLPLPPRDRFAYVGTADEPELCAYVNKQFEHGVRWSCGGRVPFELWTIERPRRHAYRNIDPFSWGFGLVTALQGRVFLDEPNRAKLRNRVSRRFTDPIERHQYKMLARYREEPFSGIRYPVHFNSIYPNQMRYAGAFGSSVIYGDQNEASTLVLMLAYLNATQLADVGLVRANWSFFKQAARMLLVTDDWAAHASGCREYSAGVWLDMLNCEFPGMMHYARVAEIAGDGPAAEQGYYRAAKRMVPSLARLMFADYVNRHRLAPFKARMVLGFNETDGARSVRSRLEGFNCAGAMDLFDYSQATCFDLLALYARHTPQAVRDYLDDAVRPSFRRDGKWTFAFPYLKTFAFFGADPVELRAMVRDVDERLGERLRADWPGIRQCDEVGAVIFRMHPHVYVTAHAPAALHDAVYADADGLVTLCLISPQEGVPLRLFCGRTILAVEQDEKALANKHWRHQAGVFSVVLPKGRSHWRLRLGERQEDTRPLFPVVEK